MRKKAKLVFSYIAPFVELSTGSILGQLTWLHKYKSLHEGHICAEQYTSVDWFDTCLQNTDVKSYTEDILINANLS